VLLNLAVHGLDVETSVAFPRVHHQGTPNRLLVDPDVPEDVRAALRSRGHDVAERDGVLAVAQALWVRETSGTRVIEAASDPRKDGAPAGE
jgi:gamma-glutamyltranspeptidase/glutathione hydrolase